MKNRSPITVASLMPQIGTDISLIFNAANAKAGFLRKKTMTPVAHTMPHAKKSKAEATLDSAKNACERRAE